MSLFGKLFDKRDETEYPKYAGEIERVLREPIQGCNHNWQEVQPSEWDESRYGEGFELVTPNTNPTTYRDAYICRSCGGEFVTVMRKKYT